MKLLTITNVKYDSELNEHGVYLIYLLKNNKEQKINRLIKVDYSGLLYIGAAQKTTLKYRLNCFLKSKGETKQNNHSGGNKIAKNNNLKNFLEELQLGYKVIVNENAKELEKEYLINYSIEFGEVPPLNG